MIFEYDKSQQEYGGCWTWEMFYLTQNCYTEVTFMMLLDENALHAFLPNTAKNIGSKQKCYNLVCVRVTVQGLYVLSVFSLYT